MDPTPGDETSEQGEEMDLAQGDASPPEGGDDAAPADGAGRASDDAGEDAAVSPCGPTDTVINCGSCGTTCDTTTGSPSCNGTTCSYACNAGQIDCNTQAPDTDGCECTTPACCGSSCQTTHTDGEGQSFYDCNALGTDTEDEAMEACAAYAASIGGKVSDCSGNWVCSGQPSQACYTGSAGTQYCWGYEGAMNVYPNYCPSSAVGTWD
jgi:hypothetical protein